MPFKYVERTLWSQFRLEITQNFIQATLNQNLGLSIPKEHYFLHDTTLHFGGNFTHAFTGITRGFSIKFLNENQTEPFSSVHYGIESLIYRNPLFGNGFDSVLTEKSGPIRIPIQFSSVITISFSYILQPLTTKSVLHRYCDLWRVEDAGH